QARQAPSGVPSWAVIDVSSWLFPPRIFGDAVATPWARLATFRRAAPACGRSSRSIPAMPITLLPTTVVGSYPQPDWLIDRGSLSTQAPPRVRLEALWRVPKPWLDQAQDDATVLAIRDLERAGVDIVSDGEMRRESYSNRFATALDGVDIDRPGEARTR